MHEAVEIRNAPTGEIEFRSVDGRNLAVGYAAVFDSRSSDLGGFTELVGHSAFTKTLQEFDQLALHNHDTSRLLGRVSNQTLNLSVDNRGLHYEINLPDTPTGTEVRELLRRGDLKGSSFGFVTIRDSWTKVDGVQLRTLEEVALHEISVVSQPAYPDASAALRSLDLYRSSQQEEEVPEVEEREEEEPQIEISHKHIHRVYW